MKLYRGFEIPEVIPEIVIYQTPEHIAAPYIMIKTPNNSYLSTHYTMEDFATNKGDKNVYDTILNMVKPLIDNILDKE